MKLRYDALYIGFHQLSFILITDIQIEDNLGLLFHNVCPSVDYRVNQTCLLPVSRVVVPVPNAKAAHNSLHARQFPDLAPGRPDFDHG